MPKAEFYHIKCSICGKYKQLEDIIFEDAIPVCLDCMVGRYDEKLGIGGPKSV